MDRRYLPVVLMVGALLGAFVAAAAVPTGAQGGGDDGTELQVTGQGQVEVDPDRAEVRLGVSVTGDTAEDARAAAANRSQRVVAALQELGLGDDAVETEQLRIYPERRYVEETGRSEVTGYRATNTVLVTTSTLSLVSDIVDEAVKSGANDVRGVSFGLTEEARKAARERAIREAVKRGQSEALTAAAEAGVTLGAPEKITVGSTGVSVYRGETVVAQAMDGASTPVSPGTVTVTATVGLAYGFDA